MAMLAVPLTSDQGCPDIRRSEVHKQQVQNLPIINTQVHRNTSTNFKATFAQVLSPRSVIGGDLAREVVSGQLQASG
jgi:hypothetical protein